MLSGKLGGGLKAAAKTGVAAMATITAAAASIGATAIATANNVATLGDNIDKMSQKMGISAQSFQEWDFILQHNGASIETMKTGMKTLVNAAESGNTAFEKLGITQQDLASMSEEDLFSATIAGLQGIEDSGERAVLAQKLLGRGSQELGALLNMSAEETEAMRQSLHDMGGVMSDEAVKASAEFADSLLDMKTAFGGFKNNLVGGFLPSLSKVMQGLTKLFTGEGGLDEIKEGISSLASGILEKLPDLMNTASTIVSAIGEAIIENLPTIVESGVTLIAQLAVGLVEAIPDLVKAIPQIIMAFISGIAGAWPEIQAAGIDVITFLLDGMVSLSDSLREKGWELMDKLKAAIEEKLSEIKDKGKAVVDNIRDGISSAWEGLKSWFKGLWDSLFGNLKATATIDGTTGGSTGDSGGSGGGSGGGSSGGSGGKSFRAGGLDFVPYNDYTAQLHRGEAVLTAREADEWRRGNVGGGGVVVNQYIQSVAQTPVQLASATEAYFEQARWAFA